MRYTIHILTRWQVMKKATRQQTVINLVLHAIRLQFSAATVINVRTDPVIHHEANMTQLATPAVTALNPKTGAVLLVATVAKVCFFILTRPVYPY